MARSSAAIVVAEGATPSLGSAPSVSSSPRRMRISRIVRAFCRELLADPSAQNICFAKEQYERNHQLVGVATAKALAPSAGHKERRWMVGLGWERLDVMLCYLGALMEVPLAILDRHRLRLSMRDRTALEALRSMADSAIWLAESLDRAAVELGLPLYDGGPFACGAPALPAGSPRLLGGAR